MNLPVTFFANFSPYHDPDPVSDFYEDTAQRVTSVVALVFAVHIAIFFMLSTRFVMPDMIEEEPEPIPVQIIAFEDLPAVPAPPPEIAELRPAVPAPAPPPKIKPQRKPPPPPPTPEPEPEPEIAPPPPPPPEILSQPIIEPEPDPLPAPAETPPPPEPEPIIQPEPVPQPIPVPPEPIVEPVIEPAPIIEMFEPLPDLVPEPLPEPEPIIEIFEPVPEIIEEPLPDVLPEPILEPEPYITPTPTELPPLPGPIIEETLPELPQLEELPPLPTPETETIVETPPALPAPEPEIIETPPDTEPTIITTAPTILASPDAPTTSEEAKTAVPQSQSDPFIDFIKKNPAGGARQPATGRPSGRNPAIAGPSAGGGNINAPPTIGTKRSTGGPTNWTLTKRPSGEGLGEGYGGLVLDMRCREAQKTHLECPEYLRKFRGRNAAGWENFNGMAGRGTDRGTTTASHIAGGGTVGGGTSQLGRIGDNSVNGGGPSTSILDDPANSFDRTFPGKDFDYGQNDGRRLRDLLTPPEDEEPIELLLTPPEE